MSLEDTEYYRHRAVAELEMADQAANANVAAIHYELAHQYAALAAQPALRPKLRIAG